MIKLAFTLRWADSQSAAPPPPPWIDCSGKDEKVATSHLRSKRSSLNMSFITELCTFTEHKKPAGNIHITSTRESAQVMKVRLPSAEFTDQSKLLFLFPQKFYKRQTCSSVRSLKVDTVSYSYFCATLNTVSSSQEKLNKCLLKWGVLAQKMAIIFLTHPTPWWPPPLCVTWVRIIFPMQHLRALHALT